MRRREAQARDLRAAKAAAQQRCPIHSPLLGKVHFLEFAKAPVPAQALTMQLFLELIDPLAVETGFFAAAPGLRFHVPISMPSSPRRSLVRVLFLVPGQGDRTSASSSTLTRSGLDYCSFSLPPAAVRVVGGTCWDAHVARAWR